MRPKIITFSIGFILYGLMFGTLMFIIEDNMTGYKAVKSGFIFVTFMGLYEVFIYPKIRNYFSKKNNKT